MRKLHHRLNLIAVAVALIWCLGLLSASGRPRAPLAAIHVANLTTPAPAPSEGRYKISPGESRFTVHASAGGLLSAVAGHDHTIAIRDFYGTVVFTYHTVTPASFHFIVKAESLAVTDKVSDSDRTKIQTTMRNEVLDVSNYPEITFKSTSVTANCLDDSKCQTKITGDLTLHGTTHAITIDALVTFHEASLQAEGQFALRQTEYGIKPVTVAGGTIKVKDELKFSFNIVANR